MKEAVIVSTARTPIAKAYRGAFNNLNGPSLGAIPVKAAVQRAGIDIAEVDDCIFGCAVICECRAMAAQVGGRASIGQQQRRPQRQQRRRRRRPC